MPRDLQAQIIKPQQAPAWPISIVPLYQLWSFEDGNYNNNKNNKNSENITTKNLQILNCNILYAYTLVLHDCFTSRDGKLASENQADLLMIGNNK